MDKLYAVLCTHPPTATSAWADWDEHGETALFSVPRLLSRSDAEFLLMHIPSFGPSTPDWAPRKDWKARLQTVEVADLPE